MSLLLFVSLLVISIDQLFKYLMLRYLVYGISVPVIKGFYSLTLVFNRGAAFGILQGKQPLFIFLPILTVIIILAVYKRSKGNEREKLAVPFGLLLGGTIGNFIDRLRFGYVIDFFDLFYKSRHWPAFNMADACICFGVLLVFIYYASCNN